jgi:NitT/TauT family transport system substrate-binding protein
VFDLSSSDGATQWLGGTWPAAGVLTLNSWVQSHQDTAQKVVDALVATMHWINTHSAADIANAMPASYTNNGLITKDVYTAALAKDKGQFLPDGMMPANGPATVETTAKLSGVDTSKVKVTDTYTNQYVIAANKLEGFTVSG